MNKDKKIKILFDAGPLVNGSKSGVGYYTQGLIKALAETYPDKIELVGHYFDFLGRKHPNDLPKRPNIRYRRTILYPGKVANALRRVGLPLPFEVFTKERGDFHLFPAFTGWPSIFRTPSAVVIHDLAYLDFPEYVSARNQKDLEKLVPLALKRSSFIATVSKDSAEKIKEHYKLINKPIAVTYNPVVDSMKIADKDSVQALNKLGLAKKYVLFVGTIEPRKNIVGMLSAYQKLPKSTRQKYSLVLAGGKGWNDDEIQLTLKKLRQLGLDIITTGYVSDKEKASLYMNASVYLCPSHYEGFNMPILEAMTYGLPVLASNIPVHREVANRAALYCDPNNTQDIASKLQDLLTSPNLQDTLIREGRLRVKEFSWSKVATDIFQHIKEAIE